MPFSRRFYPKRLTVMCAYILRMGGPGNRTHYPGVTSAMLYQLSYRRTTCFLAGNHGWQRKNNDSKHHPPFEASSLLFELNQHDRGISSLVLVNTHTCVNERITDMMSAGPFVAGLKCSGNVFGGFSSFAWQRGTLQWICNSSDHSS